MSGVVGRHPDVASHSVNRRLAWALLIQWGITEATGAKMLRTFIRRGGMRDGDLETSYPAGLVANLTLGSGASILWSLFLATRQRSLAWAAVAQFGVAVGAGTALAVPWHLAERAGRPAGRAGGPEALRYSRAVEAGHAFAAWSTAVLAAIAVGKA